MNPAASELKNRQDNQRAMKALERGPTWQPIATAKPSDGTLIGWVDGAVRLIRWGKTSHVPMYGWCLADQGAEDFDLCSPTHWKPLPPPPEGV